MNRGSKDKCKDKKALSTLLDVPCNRRKRKRRIARHLPCICFGSTQYTIAIPAYENKQSHSYHTKKPAHKVQSFRFGKPSIGELAVFDKHKKLENMSQDTKNKNAESLLLICEKVEHMKKMRDRQCVENPAHFGFRLPAFPAREEFVFRKRYRDQLPSNIPPRYLKKIPSENEIP